MKSSKRYNSPMICNDLCRVSCKLLAVLSRATFLGDHSLRNFITIIIDRRVHIVYTTRRESKVEFNSRRAYLVSPILSTADSLRRFIGNNSDDFIIDVTRQYINRSPFPSISIGDLPKIERNGKRRRNLPGVTFTARVTEIRNENSDTNAPRRTSCTINYGDAAFLLLSLSINLSIFSASTDSQCTDNPAVVRVSGKFLPSKVTGRP